MPEGHYVFAQVMQHLPLTTFQRCVERYDGERKVKRFCCLDQYLRLAFAQLTWRESLRDIEACLRAQSSKLYHLGFRSKIARNTLANANAVRDWRIYADFAQHLIGIARRLYAEDPLALELDNTVYALDSTTIDLCLSVFPWAPFRSTKAAVKLHTLLDLRGNIPSFIFISDGKMHDVNILDQLVPEAGAFYVMDRGYVDFERLARLDDAGSFFVTRAKSNLRARRRYLRPVDRSTGIICDQTVALTASIHARASIVHCGGSSSPIRRPANGWYSSPTISPSMLSPSPSFTNVVGRSNCFQMDQATPAHQGVLRHLRKRRQIANLDCRLSLRPRCHRQKTAAASRQSL
jgi:hypothetical protein